jgi:hypothetical protein
LSNSAGRFARPREIGRLASCVRYGSLDSGERLASVIEGDEQGRAARAVEHAYTTLEVSEVGSGAEVLLIGVAALAPCAKLPNDAVRF